MTVSCLHEQHDSRGRGARPFFSQKSSKMFSYLIPLSKDSKENSPSQSIRHSSFYSIPQYKSNHIRPAAPSLRDSFRWCSSSNVDQTVIDGDISISMTESIEDSDTVLVDANRSKSIRKQRSSSSIKSILHDFKEQIYPAKKNDIDDQTKSPLADVDFECDDPVKMKLIRGLAYYIYAPSICDLLEEYPIGYIDSNMQWIQDGGDGAVSLDLVQAEITDFCIVRPSRSIFRRPFVLYSIYLRKGSGLQETSCWVRRRYSHFRQLYDALTAQYPMFHVPPLPPPHSLVQLMSEYMNMPEKKTSGHSQATMRRSSDQQDSFIEGRMKRLQMWLSAILMHPILSKSEAMQIFLFTNTLSDAQMHQMDGNIQSVDRSSLDRGSSSFSADQGRETDYLAIQNDNTVILDNFLSSEASQSLENFVSSTQVPVGVENEPDLTVEYAEYDAVGLALKKVFSSLNPRYSQGSATSEENSTFVDHDHDQEHRHQIQTFEEESWLKFMRIFYPAFNLDGHFSMITGGYRTSTLSKKDCSNVRRQSEYLSFQILNEQEYLRNHAKSCDVSEVDFDLFDHDQEKQERAMYTGVTERLQQAHERYLKMEKMVRISLDQLRQMNAAYQQYCHHLTKFMAAFGCALVGNDMSTNVQESFCPLDIECNYCQNIPTAVHAIETSALHHAAGPAGQILFEMVDDLTLCSEWITAGLEGEQRTRNLVLYSFELVQVKKEKLKHGYDSHRENSKGDELLLSERLQTVLNTELAEHYHHFHTYPLQLLTRTMSKHMEKLRDLVNGVPGSQSGVASILVACNRILQNCLNNIDCPNILKTDVSNNLDGRFMSGNNNELKESEHDVTKRDTITSI